MKKIIGNVSIDNFNIRELEYKYINRKGDSLWMENPRFWIEVIGIFNYRSWSIDEENNWKRFH